MSLWYAFLLRIKSKIKTKSKETLNLLWEEMLTTSEIRSISYSNKSSKNLYNACWDEETIDFNIYIKSLILLSSTLSRQTVCSFSCSMCGIIMSTSTGLTDWLMFESSAVVGLLSACWLVGWLLIYLNMQLNILCIHVVGECKLAAS